MTALPMESTAPATATAVSARALTRRYGAGESAVDALRGVSLEVPAGQFTAVMGPSGSGKSTLMHLLAGLDRPTAGSVRIGGEEISDMADRRLTKLRRKHIGFVFQSFNLLPTLTAEENVDAAARDRAHEAGRRTRSTRLLARVGPDRPPRPQAGGALRRPAAARGHRPRADRPPDRPLRGRADGQPRLGLRRRGARAAARRRRRSTARRP